MSLECLLFRFEREYTKRRRKIKWIFFNVILRKFYRITELSQFWRKIPRGSESEKNFKDEKIKSPFHWLQLLMFNSNSICKKAMIRNNNFPYFCFLLRPLFLCQWLANCCCNMVNNLLFFFSFLSSFLLFCAGERKKKQFSFQLHRCSHSYQKRIVILYSSFSSLLLSGSCGVRLRVSGKLCFVFVDQKVLEVLWNFFLKIFI